MSKKLFVGGLSWNTTDEGLRKAFERFGGITEARVITERGTGRSRGFGFVSFGNDDEANQAVSGMDGQSVDGRTIRVSEAQSKGPFNGGRE